MDASTDIFCTIARQEFDFLVTDYGFKPTDFADPYQSSVNFESEKIMIGTWWNYRDGTGCAITSKVDTFWIRPADSHSCSLDSLMELEAPAKFYEKPRINDFDTQRKGEDLRPGLAYYARQLRGHGGRILKGDLAQLEDIKITNYCKTAKSIPWEEYARIFLEECAHLPVAEQKLLETALAERSRIAVWLLPDKSPGQRRVGTPRLLTAMDDFWKQHMQ